jgi:hypothetical protein
VPDREVELVQLPEDRRERPCRVPVHDQLTRVRPAVEAPVRHVQQAEVGERDGATRLPEPSVEARLERRGERLHGRVVRLECEKREWESEEPEHDASTEFYRGAMTSN